MLKFCKQRLQTLHPQTLDLSQSIKCCKNILHYTVLVPFLDFLFSFPQLFPAAHSQLHAPEYPFLHVDLALSCNLVVTRPLMFLLVELPSPHAKVSVAHMFLDNGGVSLSLFGHYLFERLENLLKAKGSY